MIHLGIENLLLQLETAAANYELSHFTIRPPEACGSATSSRAPSPWNERERVNAQLTLIFILFFYQQPTLIDVPYLRAH